MTIKIKDKLEQEIRNLAEQGYNCRTTAIKVGLNPETVRQWAIREKITFQTGQLRVRQKEAEFLDLLRAGYVLTLACKKMEIDFRLGKQWAIKNGLEGSIRSRGEAALDRNITLREANSRLPIGHGEVVQYDQDMGHYIIKRADGSVYTRITSQIFRGDPNLSPKRRCTEEEISTKLLGIGYKIIPNTYKNKNTPLQAEHVVCGYIRETEFHLFAKQDCPRCSNTGTSKEEASLDMWIKFLGINSKKFRFERDYPGKGRGKEIDIYIPDLKFGIEYCGFYRHGEKETLHSLNTKIKLHADRNEDYRPTDFDSPRWRHWAKMNKANKLGIQLITVFEHEWKRDPEKVKAVLKAKLGKNEINIFARKTKIREINKSESKEFLDLYHLQGNVTSMVRFGLFYNDELIAVITGSHHHRIKGKFVLNRLCFKSNITVVGGSSKLNKALENWAKLNGYSEIISWSDNRWSDGRVYEALDYTLDAEIDPDYFYFDNRGNTYSKQSCQKKHLLKKGAIGNTEWEMAQSLGYDRIWDCGKKTWVKKLV